MNDELSDDELLDPYEFRIKTAADREARRQNDELQKRKIFCHYCLSCIPSYPADRCVIRPDGKIYPACRIHRDEGDNVSLLEGLKLIVAKGVTES